MLVYFYKIIIIVYFIAKKGGNIGTLITYNDNFPSILNTFEDNDEPMIVIMSYTLLTKKSVALLHSSSVIQGIILHGIHGSFSEDGSCPSFEYSLYKNQTDCKEWNMEHSLHYDGFRFMDWNIPIFTVEDPEALNILIDECFEAFNQYLIEPSTFKSTGLRCRAKMSMFMHAAGNADMCLRRQNLYNGFTERFAIHWNMSYF